MTQKYELMGVYNQTQKAEPKPTPIYLKLEPSYGSPPNSYELRIVDENDHTLATILALFKDENGNFYVKLLRIGKDTGLPIDTDNEGDVQSTYASIQDTIYQKQ